MASQEFHFSVRINLNDQQETVHQVSLIDGAAQRLTVDAQRALEFKPWFGFGGGPWFEAVVIPLTDGSLPWQSIMQRRANVGAEALDLAFSFCGERIIALPGPRPGRCADLPPMAVPDRSLGQCQGAYCTGLYEGIPARVTAYGRLAPATEPGDRLVVTGTVRDLLGRPRAGVIVYGYQTDRSGVYPQVQPPRSYVSNYQGRLRGWARTDVRGRYHFETIRPGSYGGNPAHIHMQVAEPGCGTYLIDDLVFADDPLLERLTPEQRASETPGVGGSGVTQPQSSTKAWVVSRDIYLGAKVQGYEPCKQAR